MTTTNIESRRHLVSMNLTEQQQISILGHHVDDPGVDLARLETVSNVIFSLQNRYEPARLQTWFDKPNPHLQNRRPVDILSGDWKNEDRSVQALLIIAQNLCGDPDRAASCERCNSPKPNSPAP